VDIDQLKAAIRTVNDFPIPGIAYRDITSLTENSQAFNHTLMMLASGIEAFGGDKIIGIESRGFVFGAPLSDRLRLPFIMVRKPGKLPNDTYKRSHDLEYGSSSLEIQKNTDIKTFDKIVIMDDLIATGGTALACAQLVHENFGVLKKNILIQAVINLPELSGSDLIKASGYSVQTLIEFSGT
jgi:adenine phosphoribosyltransferase|tara:strand:+ start:632 stop:1180 length:549 start_codon:yes stop_codon:yes gene_type:complete